jgi:glyoxylase-like metal-dependent hydrolase (beta-lactamase superfamily II)
MDTVMITPQIYQLSLKIVNVFIIRIPLGLILIDTGPAGSKPLIFEAIRKIGNQPDDIKHIIVTHSHHDHSGSLADIVREVNATVYMHPHDATLVRKGVAYRFQLNAINRLFGIITIGSLIKLPYINIKPVKQITEVNDGDWIPDISGLRVIHSPGHWPGQIALFYPGDGGVIIAADVAENHSRLQLSPGYQDKDECLATIKKISGFAFNIAVFSHGGPILNNASEIFTTVFGLN